MARCSETQADAAFQRMTHDDGLGVRASCAAVLLPRLVRAQSFDLGLTTWWTKNSENEKAITKSQAAAAGTSGMDAEEVQRPTMTAEDAWQVMRKRFLVAHTPSERPASCEGVLFAPARWDARGRMRSFTPEPIAPGTGRELNLLMALSFASSCE
ncbi:hypothetical protein T484DRAFT_1976535 [Baffinella frigidus]|nr:hypothetical protein T484DRAFT_1976535 [Cryptophyta sp. CCMP2293]